ncbi:MFS transporter [Streptomyces spectabilis]|uniref:MFS transporter n=1 Tax=Streptomyces spectabilis TaxID=68270 RepID=A0A516R1Z3_STRST|nr:MFS transporter [Streptomyces spectabilis]QDQ09673.1 MFS transporter [Streptomyces spectabilis]
MDRSPDSGAARPNYPVVVTLAAGAIFLSILDATVANLAVTDMHGSFPDASVADLTWVISLYAVVFASFLAPAGRLADVLGRRRLYMVGVGLFTATSLLCAVAPGLPVLLLARALQGLGAAAMVPASLALLLADVAPQRRAAAIGLWSAAASAAAAAGPSLGGILIDSVGWRSVFFINVPLGIALLVGIRAVRASVPTVRGLPDVLGTVLLAAGTGLVVLGVTQGPEWNWDDPRVLGSIVGGLVLLALTLVRARRHPRPALQTRLWGNKVFALANLVSLFFGAALYAWLLIGALFLVDVWDYSRISAGLSMSPGAVLSAVVAAQVGRSLSRRSPHLVVLFGSLTWVAAGLWLGLTLSSDAALWSMWIPVGLLAGAGIGAVSTGVSSAAALSVDPADFAGATGLNMAVRQIGGALGIAALAAILSVHASTEADRYSHVVFFSCVTATVAGLLGLGLTQRRGRPRPKAAGPASTAAVATEPGGGKEAEL